MQSLCVLVSLCLAPERAKVLARLAPMLHRLLIRNDTAIYDSR